MFKINAWKRDYYFRPGPILNYLHHSLFLCPVFLFFSFNPGTDHKVRPGIDWKTLHRIFTNLYFQCHATQYSCEENSPPFFFFSFPVLNIFFIIAFLSHCQRSLRSQPFNLPLDQVLRIEQQKITGCRNPLTQGYWWILFRITYVSFPLYIMWSPTPSYLMYCSIFIILF